MTVYVMVIMHLKTRTILLAEATFSPDGDWLRQMARNAMMAAEELGLKPRYIIHDRDPLFRQDFDPIMRARGVEPVRTSRRAPDMNAHQERQIRSIKEECLDRLIFFGIDRLQYALDSYRKFFNEFRPHQALGQRTPLQVLQGKELPDILPDGEIRATQIERVEFLGGLLKSYRLKLAA